MNAHAIDGEVPPDRRGILAAVVLLGVAAIGLLLGWLIFAPSPPGDDSVDAGFARDMSEHHAQAVEMSLLVLQATDDTNIDVLAYDIATTQGTQIGAMQAWLDQWDLTSAQSDPRMEWMGGMDMDMDMSDATPGDPDYRVMPGMATPAQMQKLSEATGTQAEIEFLRLMIVHHVSGVDMAQAAADDAQDPDVATLADKMVKGQAAEIDLMNTLLIERGAEPIT